MALRALALHIAPEQVAALYSVSPRSLNNWIRRFNQQGIDGLIEGPRTGRPPKITLEESAHYRQLIEQPELAEQLHWTAVKFHGYLRQELQHEIGYRTVVRWLHDNNFKRSVDRGWPNGELLYPLRVKSRILELLQIFRAKLALSSVRIKVGAVMLVSGELVFTPIPGFCMQTYSHAQRCRIRLKILAFHASNQVHMASSITKG
jgi:transposase